MAVLRNKKGFTRKRDWVQDKKDTEHYQDMVDVMNKMLEAKGVN
jgi:hypothetical protein